jgi:ketosteroid isomerase-like protein
VAPKTGTMGSERTALEHAIQRYNDAWNAHDVDAIVAMHAPDMVFENHTAGERADGAQVHEHIARIFESWPDIAFTTRRLYVREDLVVQEWTASATHSTELRRGEISATQRQASRVGGPRRDPVRARLRQAQGRVLGLRGDPASGGSARLATEHLRRSQKLDLIASRVLRIGRRAEREQNTPRGVMRMVRALYQATNGGRVETFHSAVQLAGVSKRADGQFHAGAKKSGHGRLDGLGG